MFYLKNEILVEGESYFLLNCLKYMYFYFRMKLFYDVGYNLIIVMFNFDCIIILLLNFFEINF